MKVTVGHEQFVSSVIQCLEHFNYPRHQHQDSKLETVTVVGETVGHFIFRWDQSLKL